MNWAMDEGLDNMVVSGAPYGGPIAIIRDRKQFVRIMSSAKPVITIYNCVGNVITKILVRYYTFPREYFARLVKQINYIL